MTFAHHEIGGHICRARSVIIFIKEIIRMQRRWHPLYLKLAVFFLYMVGVLA